MFKQGKARSGRVARVAVSGAAALVGAALIGGVLSANTAAEASQTNVVQLIAFAVLMRHDRKVLGGVHPATWAGVVAITSYHLALEVLGRVGPFVSLAETMGKM